MEGICDPYDRAMGLYIRSFDHGSDELEPRAHYSGFPPSGVPLYCRFWMAGEVHNEAVTVGAPTIATKMAKLFEMQLRYHIP